MNTSITAPITSRRRAVPLLAQRRTYAETLDIVLDFGFGIAWFTVLTTLIATGASLLVTLVGIPILSATLYVARRIASFERHRARALLGINIPEPERAAPGGNGIVSRLAAPFRDRATWHELLYLWFVQPVLGVVGFCIVVTAWAMPLWAISVPLQAVWGAPRLWTGRQLVTWQTTLPIAVAGMIALFAVPYVVRSAASIDGRMTAWGLGAARPPEPECGAR